jgi:hypothetical protein
VEIVDPSEQKKHQHAWLGWLGLQEPPPEADSWVAVARGFELDGPRASSSRLAAQLVSALALAGIEARQRLYEFYDAALGVARPLPMTGMVTSVAVMVHERDLQRAVDVASDVKDDLTREAQEPLSGSVSEQELTRQALEAGPPPQD